MNVVKVVYFFGGIDWGKIGHEMDGMDVRGVIRGVELAVWFFGEGGGGKVVRMGTKGVCVLWEIWNMGHGRC